MSWKNWEGSLEEKSHIEKDPRISFFQSEVFRIRNPWNSNWYLQNVPQSNDVGDIQIKTDMLLHNLGFFSYYGTHVHGIYSEKGDGVWSGPGLGLWPPWNLGPAPIFQPDFPAKYVSQEDFWTLWGPSLSCQESPLPDHERTSLFFLRLVPNGLLAPPNVRWVLSHPIYVPGSLPLPLQELKVLIWPSCSNKPKTPSPGLSDPAATQAVTRAGTQK